MIADRSRLGRRVQFDERSRRFPVRELLAAKRPRSYTWFCIPSMDQGNEGSCVGFSFTHELRAKPQEISPLIANEQFAREQVYWAAQRIDPWPGGAYPQANPQYEGTSVLAGVKAVTSLGYYQSYHWAFSLDDMILAVGNSGPVVIGVNWYTGMFDPDESGRLHISGQVAGGHAILVNGVNLPGRFFTLVNSWGPTWGLGGRCTLSFDDMQRLLSEQGEVCCVKRT